MNEIVDLPQLCTWASDQQLCVYMGAMDGTCGGGLPWWCILATRPFCNWDLFAHSSLHVHNKEDLMGQQQSTQHGNAGFNVKNLAHTSGCPHYGKFAASDGTQVKCATNGCQGKGCCACHVISANQNNDGQRFLVYMCDSCNKTYDRVLHVRANAVHHELPGCRCGHWPEKPCPNGGNRSPCVSK